MSIAFSTQSISPDFLAVAKLARYICMATINLLLNVFFVE